MADSQVAKELASNSPASSAEVEPEFELTPEIMRRENQRNDLILALAAVVFAFFLGSFQETMPDIWLRLRSGQLISQTLPDVPRTDTLTYTAAGRPWVNPSWLFDYVIYLIHETMGDRVLVVLKALVGALAATLILSVRYPGPTLWWSSLCVLPALVAMSLRFNLGPEIVEMALLAAFLLLWFQARHQGRWWLIYLSIPLVALWANIGMAFPLVPTLFVLFGIGEGAQRLLPARLAFEGRLLGRSPLQMLLLAGVTGAAGFLNPYGWDGWVLPVRWFDNILPRVAQVDLTMTGWTNLNLGVFLGDLASGRLPWCWNAWSLLVLASLGSFLVNYRYFSASRLLLNIFGILLAILVVRYITFSAIILATVTSLNGQEFYLGRMGRQTRIEGAWWIWSLAGRALSIVLVAGLILAAVTGRVQSIVGRFGYGILESRYMVKGSQWLKEVSPKGRGLAFSLAPASYQAWAAPGWQNFADSRWQVVAGELTEFRLLRKELSEGADDQFLPKLDKYGITYVMIDPQDQLTRDALLSLLVSKTFSPLYVSDQVVIFGRNDDNPDRELFDKHRLDVNKRVFREGSESPPDPTERFVEAPGWVDWLWRQRWARPPGVLAGAVYLTKTPAMAAPGADYLAARSFRDAVSANPDNALANLELARTYLRVYANEAKACMDAADTAGDDQKAGANSTAAKDAAATDPQSARPTDPAAPVSPAAPAAPVAASEAVDPAAIVPEGQDPSIDASAAVSSADAQSVATEAATEPRLARIPPPRQLMLGRHYQIIAMIQNAITAGSDSYEPYLQMFAYCAQGQLCDVALANLELAKRYLTPEQSAALADDEAKIRALVGERLRAFAERIKAREEQLRDAGLEPDRPLERANLAMQLELPGLAVQELERQSPLGPEMIQAAPFAAGLYLFVGQPEKALERLRSVPPTSNLAPGERDWLMAQIRIVNGQFEEASKLLEHAIAEIRGRRSDRFVAALDGRVRMGLNAAMPIEAYRVINDLEREANFWFQLGLVRVEMGKPGLMPEAFERALALSPHFALRPIIEYYWPLATDKPLPAEPDAVDLGARVARVLETSATAEPPSDHPADPAAAVAPAAPPTESSPPAANAPAEVPP